MIKIYREMVTSSRIKKLPDSVLQDEVNYARSVVLELQESVKRHRSNASENAIIAQMNQISDLDKWRSYLCELDSMLQSRVEGGKFSPDQPVRTMAAKSNPTRPPAIQPRNELHPINVAPWHNNSEEGDGAMELAIKIVDGRFARAWRPSDGVVPGPTPADTITDVSKTSGTSGTKK